VLEKERIKNKEYGMKQHKFINLLKEDEAALKKAENKIRKELKRRETTIVKSIVGMLKRKIQQKKI